MFGLRHFPAILLVAILHLTVQPMQAQAQNLIKDFQVEKPDLDLSLNATTTIGFTLVEPCKVNLFICDIKGQKVKTLLSSEERTEDSYQEQWNGLDDNNQRVENGVYFPILQCISKRKGTFLNNPSSLTWGDDVKAENLKYDPHSSSVSFAIKTMTYGRLRVGLREGGPVFKTLAPWQLWQPGTHQVEWDGKDTQGFKSVLQEEKLSYSFDAFVLPPNSIIVSGVPESELANQPEYSTFPVHPPGGGNSSYFALHASSQQQEVALEVSWPGAKSDKEITLKGKVTCQVSFANPEKRSSTLMADSEVILYMDDTYVTELRTESLPATLNLNTNDFKNGKHVVTINLLTSDDRAGILLNNIVIQN